MIYYIIIVDGVITQKGSATGKLNPTMTPVPHEEYSTLSIGDSYTG